MRPQVVRASFRRPSLLLPAVLLAAVALAWLVAGALVRFGVAHGAGFPQGAVGLVFGAALFAYARLTRLTVSADGFELKQPFTTRRARWAEVQSIALRSHLEPTNRGGISSGIRFRLGGQARPFDIPDIFTLPKRELAALLSARLAESRQHARTPER